jgi:carbamoyltransferase
MKVLGIHDGHNSAAALIEDGSLVMALQEERFTYVKNAGGMPVHALEHLHRQCGLADVDVIAVCGKYMGTHDWSREYIIENYRRSASTRNILRQKLKKAGWVYSLYRKNKNIDRLRDMPAFLDKGRVRYVDHHLCHASSAYFGNGQHDDEVLVLTCDGFGDGRSASAYIGHEGKLEPVLSIAEADSIGRVYSYMTYLYNMVPYEHEFKIMGMAPYCTDSKRIEQCKRRFEALFRWSDEDTRWSYCGAYPSVQSAGRELKTIFEGTRFDVLAAALQLFTEETLVRWTRALIRKTGINRLAMAGGVFMNVKANQIIAAMPEVASCFVFPSCGDESNAIGAAYLAYSEEAGTPPAPLESFYLGDEPEDGEPLFDRDSPLYQWERCDDIEERVASLLAAGEIVGRVSGRMEFGARSLGNRAILANPSFPDTLRTINEMIKGRDFWMPFAPSVLAEELDRYFLVNEAVRGYGYMMFTADSRREVRAYARAALHPYDFSGRPNAVSTASNPAYHRLLTLYREKTGEGLILNTSYNLHGYPMVRDGKQAMHVFVHSGLKYLAYGSYLLSKK